MTLNDREYTFSDRAKAIECMEERLATLERLEFHVIKTEREEKKTEIEEIRMVVVTKEGKSMAVKMVLIPE